MFIFETFMFRAGILFLLLGFSLPCRPQAGFVKANLTDSLVLITKPGIKNPRTAQVTVSAQLYKGDLLCMDSPSPFYVFAEGVLMGDAFTQVCWPIDSLRNLFGQPEVRIFIYQRQGISPRFRIFIKTLLPVPVLSTPASAVPRPHNAYPDFLLSAVAVVILLFLCMTRANRLLVSGYFEVSALLSYRESEDHPMYNRVANTTNILLIITVVIMYAVLLAGVHSEGVTFGAFWQRTLHKAGAVGLWLVAKGFCIWAISNLFAIGYLKGLQYVGFVRYLMWVTIALLITEVIITYITGGAPVKLLYSSWFVWLTALVWMVLIWQKLMFQTRFSAIHIFSYLCATEVGPLLLATAPNWKA